MGRESGNMSSRLTLISLDLHLWLIPFTFSSEFLYKWQVYKVKKIIKSIIWQLTSLSSVPGINKSSYPHSLYENQEHDCPAPPYRKNIYTCSFICWKYTQKCCNHRSFFRHVAAMTTPNTTTTEKAKISTMITISHCLICTHTHTHTRHCKTGFPLYEALLYW